MRAKGLFFGKIIGLAVLVAIATPMISFADGKTSGEHLVRIYDRGEEKTIITNALTVRQALRAAKYCRADAGFDCEGCWADFVPRR